MESQSKTCFKCGRDLPIGEFYTHSAMKDGHLNKCKSCTRKDVHENYINNLAHYQDYYAKREQTSKRKEQKRQYLLSYRKDNHQKNFCRRQVALALKKGTLVKMPCEICGSIEKIQAHHEDYSKPLDIVWLCIKHHRWIHS